MSLGTGIKEPNNKDLTLFLPVYVSLEALAPRPLVPLSK